MTLPSTLAPGEAPMLDRAAEAHRVSKTGLQGASRLVPGNTSVPAGPVTAVRLDLDDCVQDHALGRDDLDRRLPMVVASEVFGSFTRPESCTSPDELGSNASTWTNAARTNGASGATDHALGAETIDTCTGCGRRETCTAIRGRLFCSACAFSPETPAEART